MIAGDRLRVYVGSWTTPATVTLDQAVEFVLRARDRGETWDVRAELPNRRRTRPLSEDEAAELVAAIAERIRG